MKEDIKIAVLGAGSVRCMPPVISALATYFGERPLEIRLYDSDEERLDLMDRFARHCFHFTEATHEILFRPDPKEALEGADRIILQVGRNCARKFLRVPYAEALNQGDKLVTRTLDALLDNLPPETDVLSLQRKSVKVPLSFYRRMDWPGEPTDEELRWLPHQILSWIKSEEQIYKFLEEQEESPLKLWLNDPNSAELVVNRSKES